MTAVLHLVFRSSHQGQGLGDSLKYAAGSDALVLLEEAVVEALDSQSRIVESIESGLAAYVLQPELAVRGLGGRDLVDGVQAIDYAQLVRLVEKFKLSQTWS